jgi:hypothetical protein
MTSKVRGHKKDDMNAVCRMLGAGYRCHRNFDRAPFVIGVVKSRRLIVGEGTCAWGHLLESGRSETEIEIDGKHPVVLYKFLL